MKKLLLMCPVIIVIVLCIIQIRYVNSNSKNVPVFTFNKQEEVKFNDNFFGNSNESSKGYSITVLGTDLYDIEVFKEKYNIPDQIAIDNYADYISLVHVKIRNCNNTNGSKAGVDMQRFILQNNSFITFFSPEVYPYVNDHPDTKFSLSEGTELDFWIPFSISNDTIRFEDFDSGDSKLVISLYPQKNMIRL